MSKNLNKLSDVQIIRKLLEQIHNYFIYLNCPYYHSELTERELLLLLVEPSERRYNLLEWMLVRLEPDIDFYIPRRYDTEEIAAVPLDYINAVSYLKNLGLCYSRVLVPEIIHANVGPIIQLKFLVRFLRGIRLKSWNRKPILKKRENIIQEIEDKNDEENEMMKTENIKNNELKSIKNLSTDDLLRFVDEKIAKHSKVRFIVEILERRLDSIQIVSFKKIIYDSLRKKSDENQNIDHNDPASNYTEMPFLKGISLLIVDEILSGENAEESFTYSSSNLSKSCSSTTVNEEKDSICTSGFVDDVLDLYNTLIKNNAVDSVEKLSKEGPPLYSTSVNLIKQMTCNGDDCPQPKPRNLS